MRDIIFTVVCACISGLCFGFAAGYGTSTGTITDRLVKYGVVEYSIDKKTSETYLVINGVFFTKDYHPLDLEELDEIEVGKTINK
jgi:hypothetical protein